MTLLAIASVMVTFSTSDWIRPARMVGGGVRRWSGFVLIAVGFWFLLLSVLPSPILV